ncbi:ribulokinase [Flavobacteriaceae bacterium GF1]
MNDSSPLVIGVDYGTASVRSLIVDAYSGEEMATSVFEYPRWKARKYVDDNKNQYRQHPLDYIEGLQHTLTESLAKLTPKQRKQIKAISVDTTGSTPVAVDSKGVPLALYPKFKDNPNAMFFLWKDHTAIKEAGEINELSVQGGINYLDYCGGIYSSEWYWAKLLHVLRMDEEVRNACHAWVEHCDWIPFLLTGGRGVADIKRSVCAAGHKALWSPKWAGFPPDTFFKELDPLLMRIVKNMPSSVFTSDRAAGTLCAEWAKKLGLDTNVVIGIGALDAHMGAVGGEIAPNYLSKVMGTSTCDMMVISKENIGDTLIPGICGQVDGSIIPGFIGLEAGQSAFGDVFAWFKELLLWPIIDFKSKHTDLSKKTVNDITQIQEDILVQLSEKAAAIVPTVTSEFAVEWLNGRRTPDANPLLTGALKHLTLGSGPPEIYRALVEATCFGAKSIVQRFIENGILVEGVNGVGGVAKKSPFVMQMMADILEMPIRIHRSEQTCALGAAMFAATVAGIYKNVQEAIDKMGVGFEKEYIPSLRYRDIYRTRYQNYLDWSAQIEKS